MERSEIMFSIDQAGMILPLFVSLRDDTATVHFNLWVGEAARRVQSEVGRLRFYPYEAFRNLLAYCDASKWNITFDPVTRRSSLVNQTMLEKTGFPYDGFGIKEDMVEAGCFFCDADRPDSLIDPHELIHFSPQPTMVV